VKKNEIKISTLIGKDSVVDGSFTAPGSARIDGEVKGNVNVEETLVLGTASVVHGDVSAQTVIVGGEVNGNIQGPLRVELTSTAKVIGDIVTSSLMIDEHAIFQGGCNMNQEVPERRMKTQAFRKAARGNKRSAAAAVAAALREVKEEQEEEERLQEAQRVETSPEAAPETAEANPSAAE
jgi:cytoskeletal protein CcmA (bactofilin family)